MLFDYIFFRIYKVYLNSTRGVESPGIYAVGFISLFQCMNFIAIFSLATDFLNIEFNGYNKIAIYAFSLSIFGLNYYRIYRRIGITILLDKWERMNRKKRKKLAIWMGIYITISVALIIFAIYRP